MERFARSISTNTKEVIKLINSARIESANVGSVPDAAKNADGCFLHTIGGSVKKERGRGRFGPCPEFGGYFCFSFR